VFCSPLGLCVPARGARRREGLTPQHRDVMPS
jgi:hypothetical protein